MVLFCPFFPLLLRRNGRKQGIGTCYVNTKNNHGHDSNRLIGPEKISHTYVPRSQHFLIVIEMNGRRISISENFWYCGVTKSYTESYFQAQIFNTTCLDL